MKLVKKVSLIIAMIVIGLGGSSYSISTLSAQPVTVVVAPWTPPYYAGVRYYYMPDIEAYYDLTDQNFIYLDNGQWLFSPALPPVYSTYNLNNGFLIALNSGIYQPWVRHTYYVSSYPRYYYRKKYPHYKYPKVRGYNENGAMPFYWKKGEYKSTPKVHNTPPRPKVANQPKKMGVPKKGNVPIKGNSPTKRPQIAPNKANSSPRSNPKSSIGNQPRNNSKGNGGGKPSKGGGNKRK